MINTLTSSVMTGVYKVTDVFGINQATLSGAIDIVVIKHPAGSRPRCLDTDYKLNTPHTRQYPLDDISIDDYDQHKEYFVSTPFHVRFGKLQLLRSNEVSVTITINDKPVDHLQMKLGSSGEAYFVVPTNKPLKHKKLLTSPLVQPQSTYTGLIPSTHIPVTTSSAIAPSSLPSDPMPDALTAPPPPFKLDQNPNHASPAKSTSPNNDDVSVSITLNTQIEGQLDSEKADTLISTISINKHNNSTNATSSNSPTLSVASSTLEDREIMSQLNLTGTGTDTATDNESTAEESTIESLDGDHDIFGGDDHYLGTHAMIEHISMSLCGHKLSANCKEAEQRKLFDDYKVSYSQFVADPSLVFDSNLIVLYKNRLYPAKIAIPMLFSILAFNKSLPNKAVAKLEENKKEKEEKDKDKDKERKSDEEHEHEHEVDDNDYSWYWSWFKKKRKKKKRQKRRQTQPQSEQLEHVQPQKRTNEREEDDVFDFEENIRGKGVLLSDGKMGYFRKSLRPSSEMLSQLPLNEGANNITFTVSSTLQGTQSICACIYLWNADSKIVISDVDGTITKSDVMGHVAPLIVGSQWSHNGVAQLFTNIQSNGYRMLYLTSRGIGQSSVTHSYLFENVKQQNYSLPSGPIIMAPDSLTTAFYREVIMKRPQEFKIPALMNIQSLFNVDHNPFYAGFGNRLTDLESYLKVGVPKNRIFIIEPSGNINTNNTAFHTTYPLLNNDVDSLFMHRENTLSKEKEEFNSFNYWNERDYYLNMDLDEVQNAEDAERTKGDKTTPSKNEKTEAEKKNDTEKTPQTETQHKNKKDVANEENPSTPKDQIIST